MKILLSPKTIILSFMGIAISFAGTAVIRFAGTTAITIGVFEAKTVNAQTKLQSVPEIGWSTQLSSFELDSQDEGQVFTFRCPTAPQTQVYAPVWGTNVYTLNSRLCQAAVHSGMITFDGGLINVELISGESNYQGSTRFGVKSKSYEGEVDSFRFIGNPIALDSDETNDEEAQTQSRRRPSAIERTVGNGVRRGIERTIEDSIRDIFR